MLATQPATRQECLATSVDDETGSVRRQRQLGMVCRGEPVRLWAPLTGPVPGQGNGAALRLFGGAGAVAAAPVETTPLLLTVDQAGALFLFDPLQLNRLRPGLAQSGGERVAEAVDDNPGLPPLLLPGPDSQSAYEIACPGRDRRVLVRQVRRHPTARRVKVEDERLLALEAPLGGRPAVVGNRLLLPLENGKLVTAQLPLDGSAPGSRPAARDPARPRGARLRAGTGAGPLPDDRRPAGHHALALAGGGAAAVAQGRQTRSHRSGDLGVARASGWGAALLPESGNPRRVQVAVVNVEGKVTLLDVRPDGEAGAGSDVGAARPRRARPLPADGGGRGATHRLCGGPKSIGMARPSPRRRRRGRTWRRVRS